MVDPARALKQFIEAEMMAGVEEVYMDKKGRGAGPEAEPLHTLRGKVSSCEKCELAGTRTNIVFGEGAKSAELMFVGEAPGRDEDIQARPFVGRAGQLLTDIIDAMGLKRQDVYIANILKCRPPENRNPLPREIASCSPYLLQQIDLIRPRVICALGKFAAQTLLNTETPISALRGKFHDYRGIKLMPTYHPAYLFRNPGAKKDVWKDMKLIAKELGLTIPKRKK
jgi:uracil-DNA glycosylase